MKSFLYLCLIFFATAALGQGWELRLEIPFESEITTATFDRNGRLLVGTPNGSLYRFDSDYQESQVLSEIGNSPVSQIEAWNGLKTFVYYRDIQQYMLIDRFSTKPVKYALRDMISDYARVVTPGIDNSLWILVSGTNELRKYQIQNGNLLFSTPLNLSLQNATQMSAFKNQLIIGDSTSGLYFFDAFANLLKQIEIPHLTGFYIDQNQLIGLTSNQTRIELDLTPFGKISQSDIGFLKLDKVLCSSQSQLVGIKNNRIMVYRKNASR